MNTKNKLIMSALVLIIIILAVALNLKQPPSNEQPIEGSYEYTIGVIAPLSGDLSHLGQGFRDGIKLALDDTGKTKNKYKVIFEDDQFDSKLTTSAATKLIDIDHADILLSMSSKSGNVVAPLAEVNHIPHFGIASDMTIAKQGKYNFIHWTPPEEEVRVFIDKLQHEHINKLGAIIINDPGGIAIYEEVKKQIQQTPISITSEQIFNSGERDFKTIIKKAELDNADIYLVLAYTPEIEMIVKQIQESQSNIQPTSIESFELSGQREVFEGYWYINVADTNQIFTDQFTQAFNYVPESGAANGYDMVHMLIDVIENIDQTQRVTSEQITDGLLKIKNHTGPLGDIYINEDGVAVSQAVVREIRDGKPVTISN